MFLCVQLWPLTSKFHLNQLSFSKPLLFNCLNFVLVCYCLDRWLRMSRTLSLFDPVTCTCFPSCARSASESKRKASTSASARCFLMSFLRTIGSRLLSDHKLSGLSGKEPGPNSQPPPTDLGSAVTLCLHCPLWIQHPLLGPKPRSHIPSCLLQHPQMCRLWLFAPSTLAHFSLSFFTQSPHYLRDQNQSNPGSPPPSPSYWTSVPCWEHLEFIMLFTFTFTFITLILWLAPHYNTWPQVANAPPWPINVFYFYRNVFTVCFYVSIFRFSTLDNSEFPWQTLSTMHSTIRSTVYNLEVFPSTFIISTCCR